MLHIHNVATIVAQYQAAALQRAAVHRTCKARFGAVRSTARLTASSARRPVREV
jgi:hypothetical protein